MLVSKTREVESVRVEENGTRAQLADVDLDDSTTPVQLLNNISVVGNVLLFALVICTCLL